MPSNFALAKLQLWNYIWHMPSLKPPLSVLEAAKQKEVAARTVRYAILHGALRAHKMPGRTGAYVINQRDLDRWFAKREASKSVAS